MIPPVRHARPQATGRAAHTAQKEDSRHQETDIDATG